MFYEMEHLSHVTRQIEILCLCIQGMQIVIVATFGTDKATKYPRRHQLFSFPLYFCVWLHSHGYSESNAGNWSHSLKQMFVKGYLGGSVNVNSYWLWAVDEEVEDRFT